MNDSTPATPEPRGSILDALDEISATAPPEGITLAALVDLLDDRAFGAVLFALAIPCCIPFLYGVPQVVALPMMALTLQMVVGRNEPWMPEKFAARRIDADGLRRIAKGGRRYFGWAERISHPRLQAITGPLSQRVAGVLLTVFCASILGAFAFDQLCAGLRCCARCVRTDGKRRDPDGRRYGLGQRLDCWSSDPWPRRREGFDQGAPRNGLNAILVCDEPSHIPFGMFAIG